MVERQSRDKNIKQYLPWLILLIAVYLVYSQYSAGSGTVSNSDDVPSLESTATPKPAQPATEETEAGKNRQVEVLVEPLNLRAQPTKAANNVIASLTKSSQLTLQEQSNGWLKVSLPDGRSGYVAYDKRYVRIK